MAVINITQKDELDTLLAEFGGVVILDFYADWCGPCKMLSPIFTELASEYDPSEVKFVKIDTEQAQELSMMFGISSIPTVVYGVNHQLVEGFLGLNQKEFYQGKIKEYLAKVGQETTPTE